MRILFASVVLLFSTAAGFAEEPVAVTKILAEKCSLCHGDNGEASSAIYPRLAAQHRTYLVKQLRNFRDGTRRSETMTTMAKLLKDEEIEAIADFYSGQPALSHRIRNSRKDLAAVGYYIYHKGNEFSDIPPCASCHGDNGEGDANLPRLAGQHRQYLVAQIEAFHDRKRTNDNAVMHSVAKRLTELEIHAVSLYASGL